jgi:ribose 5-phosphate isomerase A
LAESSEGSKRAAAARAVEEVRSGMRLGLGTGSTVSHFLDLLGARLQAGEVSDLVGVPTSVRTAEHATRLGMALGDLHELAPLDLTVDGADEIDPRLRLIKGLGGALLREKMVAQASRQLIVIADASKVVRTLGEQAPLPVEVVPFAWETHGPFLERLGAHPELRRTASGEPYVTDNGNYVFDCRFEGGIAEPEKLEAALRRRTGVVASGLFLGLASLAFVAGEAGVRVLLGDEGER